MAPEVKELIAAPGFDTEVSPFHLEGEELFKYIVLNGLVWSIADTDNDSFGAAISKIEESLGPYLRQVTVSVEPGPSPELGGLLAVFRQREDDL